MYVLEIEKTKLEKNFSIGNGTWSCIEKLEEKLKEYGISLENYQVIFDMDKINKDSFAKKNNVNGMSYMASKNIFGIYEPEIMLVNHYGKNFNKRIGYPKQINSLFPVSDFLINVFNVIGIKLYKEDENNENIENLDDIIKKLESENSSFTHNFKFLKSLIDSIKQYENHLPNVTTTINNFLKSYDFEIDEQKIMLKKIKEEINGQIQIIKEEIEFLEDITNERSEDTFLEAAAENDLHCNNIILQELENIFKNKDIYDIELEEYEYIPEQPTKYINIKYEIIINDFRKEQKKLNITYRTLLNNVKKSLLKINILKINQYKNFILNNIKFELILFPEIFNLETDPQKTTDEINFIKHNYIYYAKQIEKGFDNINNFIPLMNLIDDFLENMYKTNKI